MFGDVKNAWRSFLYLASALVTGLLGSGSCSAAGSRLGSTGACAVLAYLQG
jgi:hypothetical protein